MDLTFMYFGIFLNRKTPSKGYYPKTNLASLKTLLFNEKIYFFLYALRLKNMFKNMALRELNSVFLLLIYVITKDFYYI